jgi:peptide alpha-N-acetyltransferase
MEGKKEGEGETGKSEFGASEIEYVSYGGEHHLPLIMSLVDQELSEPYSIFTYRYFVYLWPQLSFLVPFAPTSLGFLSKRKNFHSNFFFFFFLLLYVLAFGFLCVGLGFSRREVCGDGSV